MKMEIISRIMFVLHKQIYHVAYTQIEKFALQEI
jgi:hypothetical protein